LLIRGQFSMWGFRNHSFRGPDGSAQRARHDSLDIEIAEELTRGPDGVLPRFAHELSRSFEYLSNLSIPGKEKWLETVRVARNVTLPAPAGPQQQPAAAGNRALMERWLGLGP
jgi:hypothetical protein